MRTRGIRLYTYFDLLFAVNKSQRRRLVKYMLGVSF